MKIKLKKENKACPERSRGGFSLIEVLVSVAIFAMVMVIAVGSLMSMLEANRKARSLQLVMDNLNFVIEDMARTIRLGTTYHCGPNGDIQIVKDCSTGESEISIEPTGGVSGTLSDQVTYRLNNGVIEKRYPNKLGSGFVQMTSNMMVIDDLQFYVTGAEVSGDKKQPMVVIVLSGYAKESEKTLSNFNIQTTVTQRILDF